MHTCRLTFTIDLHFRVCRSIFCHVTWEYSKLLSCIWSNLKRELATAHNIAFLLFPWAKLVRKKIGTCSSISHRGTLHPLFPDKIWIKNSSFLWMKGKQRAQKKLPSDQGENSAHLWCKIQDRNLSNTGEKEITLTTVLSLLPCDWLWVKPKGKLKRMMFQPVSLGHNLFTSHHSLCSDCSVYAITLFHCHAIKYCN